VVLDADMLAALLEDGVLRQDQGRLAASLPRRSPSSRANQRA
jgi:hypothetical protein